MEQPPPQSGLLDLPLTLLAALAKSLCPKDVAQARCSCRAMAEALPRLRLLEGPRIRSSGQHDGHFVREPYLDVDSPLPGALLSVSMSCSWCDQGYGNRKGHFVLQLIRGQPPEEVVVAETEADPLGFAPHHGTMPHARGTLWAPSDPVVSNARTGDKLRLLKVVGGGGGHMLFVENFRMLLVLPSRHWACQDEPPESLCLPGGHNGKDRSDFNYTWRSGYVSDGYYGQSPENSYTDDDSAEGPHEYYGGGFLVHGAGTPVGYHLEYGSDDSDVSF